MVFSVFICYRHLLRTDKTLKKTQPEDYLRNRDLRNPIVIRQQNVLFHNSPLFFVLRDFHIRWNSVIPCQLFFYITGAECKFDYFQTAVRIDTKCLCTFSLRFRPFKIKCQTALYAQIRWRGPLRIFDFHSTPAT